MASFQNINSYPGANSAPGWWYQGGTTWTSATTTIYPQLVQQQAPRRPKKPKTKRERTGVEWLRGRVQEICDLAELAA